MILTRAAFFKWLAQIVTAPVCMGVVDGEPMEIECPPYACKKAEARCPLGHCQKPLRLHVVIGDIDETIAEVCSQCGIVYVPPAAEKK